MAGIGIITNPHSKLNKQYPHRQLLLTYIAGEQGKVAVTNDLDELYKVAQEFSRKNIKILAINGGDGTISRTLTAFIHVYKENPLPHIVLLRGGTMNMLADNLQIQGTPEHLLFRLIEAHSTGFFKETIHVPTLKIGDQYGFLFANGTSARYLAEFYQNKTGAWGALALIGRLCLSYLLQSAFFFRIVQQDPTTLQIDAQPPLSHGSASVFCSTVKQLPMKIPFFQKLEANPDRFECISIQLPPNEVAKKLASMLWFCLRNQQNPHSYWVDFCCKRLAISTSTASPYTLDGELFMANRDGLSIELGPTIAFLIPA